MAATNGVRRPNPFEPPASSILASRIVNADDAFELNQASFNQLLAESLGNDESGQPNLGSDVSVNLKVIEIIVKAGIDTTLRDIVENPFRSNGAPVESNAQFLSCLEVIRTAIERSPGVLFASTSITGGREHGAPQPLYIVLVPRLISALTPHYSPDCIKATTDAILACVHHAATIALASSQHNPVFDLTLGSILGE